MVEQTAVVVRAESAGVWVEAVEPSSGCGACDGRGCGSRRLAEMFQRGARHFQVDSELALRVGDRVIVGIADGSVLRSAGRAYGVPLAGMLAGALLAQAVWPGDASAVAGLAAGGVAGVLGSRGVTVARPRVLRHESESGTVMKKGQSCSRQ
jgi:sigma-E factor negative regulatory protein RseC